MGYITEYSYDAFGRIVKTVQPGNDDDVSRGITDTSYRDLSDNPVNIVTHDDNFFISTVTGPEGAVTVYDFNIIGQLVKIEKQNRPRNESGEVESGPAEKIETLITYDSRGNIETVTDPLQKVTQYGFDTIGRNNRITYPGNKVVTMEMDYYTNEETVTNERGHKTEITYDMKGRVIKQVQHTLSTDIVNYVYYDRLGNRVATIDGNGNKSVNVYDERNLLKRSILPPNEMGEGFYVNDILLTNVTPFVEYRYNLFGVKEQEIASYTGQPESEKIRIFYDSDELGRVYRTRQTYNSRIDPGPISTDTVLLEGTIPVTVTQKVKYDANGNQLEVTDGNNHTVKYTYSARNKPLSEEDAEGGTHYFYLRLSG